ncbi:MAG: CoA transferase [Chloroflexi bacterium]|nr:CoA transferase [Chloroflexota bacterium]
MAGPLDGLKVMEVAEALAGPYAAMALGDAGADVTKIESLDGDRTREWGSRTRGDLGAVFAGLNRNKRSVALDPSTPEARATALRLAKDADVVIVDVGWDARIGLTYDAVKEINPRAVYLSISEWGDKGPWANQPPYGELAAQLAAETTLSLGYIGEKPVRQGTDVGSMYAGIYGIQAINAALIARERTGRGQRIDVSLFGGLMALRSTLWVALSNPDFWWGFHLDSYIKPPDHGYAAGDGQRVFFSLARMTPEERNQLHEELGGLDWLEDEPRKQMFLEDRGGGGTRYGYLITDLWEKAFSTTPADRLIEIVRRLGGWAFPLNDYQTLFDSDQVAAVGMLDEMEYPGLGKRKTMVPPWEFADTEASIRRPPPALGEHTAEVLAEIG